MSVSPSWMPHFQKALDKRQRFRVSGHTDIYRLIHDVGDGCPGLFIDVYHGHARLEAHDAQWVAQWPQWVAVLKEFCPEIKSILATVRDKKGKTKEVQSILGQTPEMVIGYEHGLRFALRLNQVDALGTGLFADMRLTRQRVRNVAAGKTVLNLFAHAGAFGVVAAVGGARRVDHLDAARKCAPWAALNMALNGVNPRQHRFLVEDAMKYLRKIAKKGNVYDMIICDPPATAIAPGGKRWTTKENLDFYTTSLVKALSPGGIFVFSTNDRSLSLSVMQQEIHTQIITMGRAVKEITPLLIDTDFPEKKNAPRLRSMRGVWVHLGD